MRPKTISATRFKAECLRLMDEVARSRQPIIITKHRRPVARLLPAEDRPAKKPEFLGRLQGQAEIVGDITSSIPDWEILS